MGLDVSTVGDIRVVSVHDEEEPIHFHIPSVVPSRYDIPGVNGSKEQFDACKFSLPGAKPVRYAVRRTLNNRPYVLVKVIEPNTFIYGTEQQKIDEHGQKLSPDIMRVPVPVRAELIANEIERIHGNMGMKAIRGEVTEDILNEVQTKYIEFLRRTVSTTTIWAKKNPGNVTPQARRRAWALHKMGQLDVMPEWAVLDPEAVGSASAMFNCINCKKLINRDTIKCQCGAIYDWKQALSYGFVKPNEVPDDRRVEAGLPPIIGVQAAVPLVDASKIKNVSSQLKNQPAENATDNLLDAEAEDLAAGNNDAEDSELSLEDQILNDVAGTASGGTSAADLRAIARDMARE